MSLSKRVNGLLLFLILLIISGFIVHSVIYKPHTTTSEQQARFTGTALDFSIAVDINSEKFKNAFVVIIGKVNNVDAKGIMLNSNIYCQFQKPDILESIHLGGNLIIKGRFIGYDDLLEEIKLDKCIVIEN